MKKMERKQLLLIIKLTSIIFLLLSFSMLFFSWIKVNEKAYNRLAGAMGNENDLPGTIDGLEGLILSEYIGPIKEELHTVTYTENFEKNHAALERGDMDFEKYESYERSIDLVSEKNIDNSIEVIKKCIRKRGIAPIDVYMFLKSLKSMAKDILKATNIIKQDNGDPWLVSELSEECGVFANIIILISNGFSVFWWIYILAIVLIIICHVFSRKAYGAIIYVLVCVWMIIILCPFMIFVEYMAFLAN